MEKKKHSAWKLNIVDIIILAIVVIGVAFLGMKVLKSDGSDATGGGVRVEYTVFVPDVDARVCENILAAQEKNGQSQLMANGALVDGYVTQITSAPHITHEPSADGVVVTAQETGPDAHVDMIFTIQAAADSSVTYKVGTQEVRVGKSHIVKTADFELEGYEGTVILSRQVIG